RPTGAALQVLALEGFAAGVLPRWLFANRIFHHRPASRRSNPIFNSMTDGLQIPGKSPSRPRAIKQRTFACSRHSYSERLMFLCRASTEPLKVIFDDCRSSEDCEHLACSC